MDLFVNFLTSKSGTYLYQMFHLLSQTTHTEALYMMYMEKVINPRLTSTKIREHLNIPNSRAVSLL